jgi:hypothetical protein
MKISIPFFSAICLLPLLTGCFGDPAMPVAYQDLHITLREQPSGKTIGNANVSAISPASNQFSSETKKAFEHSNCRSGTTDNNGQTNLRLGFNVPKIDSLEDMVTHHSIAFRIEISKGVLYLYEKNVEAGDQMSGAGVELTIEKIEKPYANSGK